MLSIFPVRFAANFLNEYAYPSTDVLKLRFPRKSCFPVSSPRFISLPFEKAFILYFFDLSGLSEISVLIFPWLVLISPYVTKSVVNPVKLPLNEIFPSL